MAYVSCILATPDPLEPVKSAGERPIVCTDENGVEWHLTEDSQVGDWLRFLEEGNTVRTEETP